jgi:hypothetical protein
MSNTYNHDSAPVTVAPIVGPLEVASFALPISIKSLSEISETLTREHGPGLTMREDHGKLIVERPNTPEHRQRLAAIRGTSNNPLSVPEPAAGSGYARKDGSP